MVTVVFAPDLISCAIVGEYLSESCNYIYFVNLVVFAPLFHAQKHVLTDFAHDMTSKSPAELSSTIDTFIRLWLHINLSFSKSAPKCKGPVTPRMITMTQAIKDIVLKKI